MTRSADDAPRDARQRRCPTLADLHIAASGELPRLQQLRVLLHVLRCAACRATLREWQMIREIVLAESIAHAPSGKPVDGPTYARFLQRLQAQERELVRVQAPPTRRWVAVSALISVALGSLLLTRGSGPTAGADEVLSRAAAEETSRTPGTMQRVRYALTYQALGRPSTVDAFTFIREVPTIPADNSIMPSDAVPAALREALQGFRFDWRRPLSVDSIRAWRAGTPRTQDSVSSTRDGRLLLRSISPAGRAPRIVELDIRSDTYHVTRQALVFDGLGRFEVEEAALWVRQSETSAPLVVTNSASPDALDLAELDARLVLQQTGLDLASVHVSRTAERVDVTGAVASDDRRRDALSLLARQPLVRADIRTDAAVEEREAWTLGPGARRWLATAYRQAPARERYIAEVAELAARVPRRLSSLQALATRYPSTVTARLSAAARKRLGTLVDRHYRALRDDLFALRSQLSAPLGTSPMHPSNVRTPADWRARATRAAPQAVAFERQLRMFVATAADFETRGAVNAAFDRLWDTAIAGRPDVSELPPDTEQASPPQAEMQRQASNREPTGLLTSHQ